ncbi:MAG TPA: hypothetical protein VKD28_03535 [Gemmatimonadales bacterium]|nr:hypothetical protein [Gemmatimonadales bacterium]
MTLGTDAISGSLSIVVKGSGGHRTMPLTAWTDAGSRAAAVQC